MQITTLEDVTKYVDKTFRKQINDGMFELAGNDKCMILTYIDKDWQGIYRTALKRLTDKPPIGLSVWNRGERWYFVPMNTPRDEYNLAEVQTWAVGEELLVIQKKKKAIIAELAEKIELMNKKKENL